MMPRLKNQAIKILLVEDNPADVDLIIEIFSESIAPNEIFVAKDGIEAMQFFRREGEFANAPLPDLVLLDLNLPKKDGRQVLAELKADPDFKHIPVVILTSSEAERDLLEAYRLHANCYIAKPGDLDVFLKSLTNVAQFWMELAKLP